MGLFMYIFVLLFLSLPGYTMDLKESPEKELTLRLPALTDYLMEADFGNSPFYDYTKSRNYMGIMHQQGPDLPAPILENIFTYGLMQWYIHGLIGYDCSYNYVQIFDSSLSKSPYDLKKFQTIWTALGKDKKEINKMFFENPQQKLFFKNLSKFTTALQKNEALNKAGGAFQRVKVVVEKLSSHLHKNPNAQMEKTLYSFDRIAIDLQVMCYYWVKEACEMIRQKGAEYNSALLEEELTQYIPSFAKKGIYHDLLQKISFYCEPMNILDHRQKIDEQLLENFLSKKGQ